MSVPQPAGTSEKSGELISVPGTSDNRFRIRNYFPLVPGTFANFGRTPTSIDNGRASLCRRPTIKVYGCVESCCGPSSTAAPVAPMLFGTLTRTVPVQAPS